jgi:hypothetical protein
VREDRFVALRAILDLDRGHVVMTPAMTLSGLGSSSLGYGHDSSRGKSGLQRKTVILGRQADHGKDTYRSRLGRSPGSCIVKE